LKTTQKEAEMSTTGITKPVFGITQAQKTQRGNERQGVARLDSESKDLKQRGKEQFNPSKIFLALALKSFDLWSL
jgi:hypothetical protein